MNFETKEQLIKQARKDEACREDSRWIERQPDLESVLENCSCELRVWALEHDYEQFLRHLDELESFYWRWVLIYQPKYIEYCDKGKLTDRDWRYVIIHQPHLAQYRNTTAQ